MGFLTVKTLLSLESERLNLRVVVVELIKKSLRIDRLGKKTRMDIKESLNRRLHMEGIRI